MDKVLTFTDRQAFFKESFGNESIIEDNLQNSMIWRIGI